MAGRGSCLHRIRRERAEARLRARKRRGRALLDAAYDLGGLRDEDGYVDCISAPPIVVATRAARCGSVLGRGDADA